MSRDNTLLRLHSVPGLGPQALNRILSWASELEEQLDSVFEMKAPEIEALFQIKDDVAQRLLESSVETSELLAEALLARGFRIVSRQDDAYPHAVLERLGDKAPPILYIHGNAARLCGQAVAFSGSRQVSEQGRRHTEELAAEVVQREYMVVSGHAPGVDVIAHHTAVGNGGRTVLVLPEGALTFRLNRQLRDLYSESPSNFIILSEFPPQMQWSAGNAMRRNKTILGLSRALVVIEASEIGGTMSAGNDALKLGIPLYVVDYLQPPEGAGGNRVLLQKGAFPISLTPKATLPTDFGERLGPNSLSSGNQLPLL